MDGRWRAVAADLARERWANGRPAGPTRIRRAAAGAGAGRGTAWFGAAGVPAGGRALRRRGVVGFLERVRRSWTPVSPPDRLYAAWFSWVSEPRLTSKSCRVSMSCITLADSGRPRGNW